MAIQDMKGTVSTTGMVNSKPPKIEAPDMSNIYCSMYCNMF